MKKINILILVGFVVVVGLLGFLFDGKGSSVKSSDLTAAGKTVAAVYCSDTDNGLYPAVSGEAKTYTLDRKGSQVIKTRLADSCGNTKTLTEGYCSASTIQSMTASCNTTGGCVNGACVGAPMGDTVAPTVTMTSPANGSSICQGQVKAIANVDDTGSFPPSAGNVSFYIDNTLDSNPVTFQIPNGYMTSNYITSTTLGMPFDLGQHAGYTRACDASGNCANSSPITFTVGTCSTS